MVNARATRLRVEAENDERSVQTTLCRAAQVKRLFRRHRQDFNKRGRQQNLSPLLCLLKWKDECVQCMFIWKQKRELAREMGLNTALESACYQRYLREVAKGIRRAEAYLEKGCP